ncbi:MAG: hypothetical protein Q4C20_15170, partial [Erysipelotrichaceae bacterium]|nr:hypothetical protein [Erysipelotrichaceae bacterium]
MSFIEVPAICPLCDGDLYLEINDDTPDDEIIECAYCNANIRVGDAIEKYNRINFPERFEPVSVNDTKPIASNSIFDIDSIRLDVFSGKEAISTGIFNTDIKMYFNKGIPGILWFDRGHTREYEVLDYWWEGPKYQDLMITDNNSRTKIRGGRKGRVTGAVVGSILAPGVGTLIGAAVGTGKKETVKTRGQTVMRMETQEIPAVANMKLRDVSRDQIITIGFMCTSDVDARIRNSITCNLEADKYAEYVDPTPESLPAPEPERSRKLYEPVNNALFYCS